MGFRTKTVSFLVSFFIYHTWNSWTVAYRISQFHSVLEVLWQHIHVTKHPAHAYSKYFLGIMECMLNKCTIQFWKWLFVDSSLTILMLKDHSCTHVILRIICHISNKLDIHGTDWWAWQNILQYPYFKCMNCLNIFFLYIQIKYRNIPILIKKKLSVKHYEYQTNPRQLFILLHEMKITTICTLRNFHCLKNSQLKKKAISYPSKAVLKTFQQFIGRLDGNFNIISTICNFWNHT